jgi:hypothetical protein
VEDYIFLGVGVVILSELDGLMGLYYRMEIHLLVINEDCVQKRYLNLCVEMGTGKSYLMY